MKKLIYIMLATSLGLSAIAQDNQPYGYYFDALRFSQTYTGGSARIQGLGGSYMALGADVTTIGDNPAGLGLFNKSVFSITGGFRHVNSSGKLNGNTIKDQRIYGSFDNIGLVIRPSARQAKGWLGGAVGLSINKINDFNNEYRYRGTNNRNSLVDYFIESANGTPAGNLPYLDEATDITTLAYHTYLIGPWNVVDPSYPDDEYFSDVTSFLRPTLTQEELVRTRGSQYQISLGYGGNLHDMLYLGLSVNMLTLDYEADKYYSEYNFDYSADDPNYNPIREINLEEQLAISGTGFKAAFGLIFRPVPFLRVGASVTTPTYYTLRDSYRAALSADWNNFYYQDIVGGDTTLNYLSASSVPVESRYRLYTPFKISGGAALFLGKAGFITLDAEYQDYRNNWLSADNFSMDADNAYMENNFYQALNLKAGAELRINVMRLRAGYAIYQVPLNADLDYTPTNQQFSAGAGLRLKNFYTDLTLLNQQFSTAYTPYYLADNSQPVADIKQSNFKVLLTLGFRF